MLRATAAALIFVCACAAQVTLSLGPPVAAVPPGTSGIEQIVLTGVAFPQGPAALQFTFTTTSDITNITGAVGSAATAAVKQIACSTFQPAVTSTTTGTITCIVYGLNGNLIGNGPVALLSLTVGQNPVYVSEPIAILNQLGVTPPGSAMMTQLNPVVGTFPVVSPCSLSGSDTVGMSDVMTMIEYALAATPEPICGNQACNVVNVMYEILAALPLNSGLTTSGAGMCRTGPG